MKFGVNFRRFFGFVSGDDDLIILSVAFFSWTIKNGVETAKQRLRCDLKEINIKIYALKIESVRKEWRWQGVKFIVKIQDNLWAKQKRLSMWIDSYFVFEFVGFVLSS